VSNTDDQEQRARIRRAPKFSVFLVIGAVVGIFVSLILTASYPIDPTVGFGATFGYFAIYGFVGGLLLGSIVALIFDRVLSRHSMTVPVTVDYLLVPDQEPAAGNTAAAERSEPSAPGAPEPDPAPPTDTAGQ